jgi:mRNA interferase MazF
MDASATGIIVLVPFPFSDLSSAKLRPALVLVDVGMGDKVCVQITSNPYTDWRAIRIDSPDFQFGSLHRTSYARPGKLFTVHESLFRQNIAQLSDMKFRQVVGSVVQLLQGSKGSE